MGTFKFVEIPLNSPFQTEFSKPNICSFPPSSVFGDFWKVGFWFCFVFLVLIWYEAILREVAYMNTEILRVV